MDLELQSLLDRAKAVDLSPQELFEQRIISAAANGRLSDERITEQAMRASVTIMTAASESKSEAAA